MIEKDEHGNPEIHYTSIFRRFKAWSEDGLFTKAFESSVCRLEEDGEVDAAILHGDGSVTVGKKGGDKIGRSGHKKVTGERVIAICDRRGNVISPFITAPANRGYWQNPNRSPISSCNI